VADYFQFPLCLLAFGTDEKKRLRAIIDYNVVEYASKQVGSKSRKSLATAATALNINYTNVSEATEQGERAKTYVENFELRHGRDAFVRIGSNIFWECYKASLTYRDFSIICALNSIIGASKRPKRVTEPSIRVRAAGYKSWNVLRAEVSEDRWPAILLSRDKIRYSLSVLHGRGLFARARIGARTVMYMTNASDAELRAEIIELEKKKAEKADYAHKDRELRDRIAAIRRPINVGKATSINVGKTAAEESQRSPDTAPEMITDMTPDINESSLMNASNESVNNGVGGRMEKVEDGYFYKGEFFSGIEANTLAVANHEFLFNAKKAIRHGDGRVETF